MKRDGVDSLEWLSLHRDSTSDDPYLLSPAYSHAVTSQLPLQMPVYCMRQTTRGCLLLSHQLRHISMEIRPCWPGRTAFELLQVSQRLWLSAG